MTLTLATSDFTTYFSAISLKERGEVEEAPSQNVRRKFNFLDLHTCHKGTQQRSSAKWGFLAGWKVPAGQFQPVHPRETVCNYKVLPFHFSYIMLVVMGKIADVYLQGGK